MSQTKMNNSINQTNDEGFTVELEHTGIRVTNEKGDLVFITNTILEAFIRMELSGKHSNLTNTIIHLVYPNEDD